MIRAIILFEAEPDPSATSSTSTSSPRRSRARRSGTGRIFGSPFGEPTFRHYAEFEWDDMESFKAAANGPEFAAVG